MQYKSTPSGTHILDCPELDNLFQNIDNYFRTTPTINSSSLFQAINDYINIVKTYINAEFKDHRRAGQFPFRALGYDDLRHIRRQA